MSECLRDRTLLLMFEGEGASTDQAHLEACEACADRYRRLVHDIEVIEQVLREEPPRQALYRNSRSLNIRWIPAVVALAFLIVSVWGVMRAQRTTSPVPSEETRNESAELVLDEVSTAIFSVSDDTTEIPYSDSDFSYLDTALGEEGAL